MHRVRLADAVDLAEWRQAARALLQARIPPEAVSWSSEAETGDLFGDPFGDLPGDAAGTAAGTATPAAPASEAAPAVTIGVPAAFVELADTVLAHRDPQRHALLYRLLWRLAHGERGLLQKLTDDDLVRARAWEKAVRRDLHKMKAFVRFREVARTAEAPLYVAWFEPEHRIVERVAPFFVRRYAGMAWAILTPDRCAHWDGSTLSFAPGGTRAEAPADDALEALWQQYFRSIFNPARLKVRAMKSEMPMKYWKNLPEAALIPELIRSAAPRAQAMVAAAPTQPRKRIAPAAPRDDTGPAGSLDELRARARDCRRCGLWQPATQTVFGEGPEQARLMLVGEQPGDHEDLAGRPFVGPAGQLLDRALAAAGLDRRTLYVTAAVKHFKFEARGPQRLHKRADAAEQAACRPWLLAELARVHAPVVVALGSTAAAALFGPGFRLLEQRGRWQVLDDGRPALATLHPAYLLRLPDAAARESAWQQLVADLAAAAARAPATSVSVPRSPSAAD